MDQWVIPSTNYILCHAHYLKITEILGFRISVGFSAKIQAKSKEQVLYNWRVYTGM